MTKNGKKMFSVHVVFCRHLNAKVDLDLWGSWRHHLMMIVSWSWVVLDCWSWVVLDSWGIAFHNGCWGMMGNNWGAVSVDWGSMDSFYDCWSSMDSFNGNWGNNFSMEGFFVDNSVESMDWISGLRKFNLLVFYRTWLFKRCHK